MKKGTKGPEFVQWFGPVLDALRDLGGSAKPKAVTDLVAKKLKISPEVLEATTKTGVPRFYNQVAWARQYLVNGGFLDSSKRGTWALTEKGRHAKLDFDQSLAVFAEVQEAFKSPLAAPLVHALQLLGGSGKPREVSELIAKTLDLPSSVLDATLKDGTPKFHNQVAWTRDYLVKTGYLDSSNRGTWVLAEKGREANLPVTGAREAIIAAFTAIPKSEGVADGQEAPMGRPPEAQSVVTPEFIEAEEQRSLLEVLRSLSPKGFEEICGLLLRESGFENVVVSGRSRDGGFDGSGRLEINPFVSLSVTFQCKRYTGSVSRAEIGDFRNSMLGRAEKGIFLTTGTFSSDARKEADRVDPKIELVDGEKLVQMFERTELGVKPRTVFDVDLQFFETYLQ